MNILQLTPRFDLYGGREEHVYNLSIALSKKGHNVKVITSRKNMRVSSFFITQGFRSVSLLISQKPTRWEYRLMPMVPFSLIKENVDILHAHDIRHFTTDVVAFVKRRVPFVVTIHWGFYSPTRFTKTAFSMYNYTIGKIVLKRAKKIIFVSKGLYDEYKSRFAKFIDKMVVIPNGVNIEELNFVNCDLEYLKHKLGLNNTKIIFTGGRIVESKGFQYLIKALPLLTENKYIKVMITGNDMGYKKELMDLAERLNIKDRIIFTGLLSRRLFKALINMADICVFPSVYEGLPTILLEAMACGKPVITTNIGGVREVVTNGKNAIIVPPCDPVRLSEAIEIVLRDETLAKTLSQNAKKSVANYDWNKIADTIVKVYEDCYRNS